MSLISESHSALQKASLSLKSLAFILMAITLVLALLSLLSGAGYLSVAESWGYLIGDPVLRNDSQLRIIMLELRLPRLVVAILVGAILGLAGCLLQTITRNTLAEPGLLGVNAGAAFGVVFGITFAQAASGFSFLVWAFGGALVANLVVIGIAQFKSTSITPLKLILAGVAIQATFQGLTALLLIKNQLSFDQYRFWVLGSLSGVSLDLAFQVVPALLLAFLLVLFIVRPLSALVLGDEVAKSLGHKPGLIRLVVAFSVTLCAGSAVALTGPIAFLGLIAPHIARSFTGPRLLQHMLFSGLIGAIILLSADILARLIAQPFETPVSVIIALLGAPMLIWIVRTGRVSISKESTQ